MKFQLLITFILVFFAVVILPVEFYSEDMVLHSIHIEKNLNNTLFKNDYLLSVHEPQILTVYYPFVSSIVGASPFTYVQTFRFLFAGYLFCLFYLVLNISKKQTHHLFVGVFFILILISTFQVGGTAIRIMELDLLPRSLSLLFTVHCFFLALSNRKNIAVIPWVLSALFHPPTALFAAIIFLSYRLLNKSFLLITFSTIITVCFVIVFYMQPTTSTTWLSIIRMRNSYAFLDLWSVRAFYNLALVLVPGVIFLFLKQKNNSSIVLQRLFVMGLFISIGLTIFHIVFAIVHPIVFIIQLQLLRIWLFPVLFSLFSLPLVISYYFKPFIQLSSLIGLILIVAFINLRKPTQDMTEWVLAQKWIRDHTALQCVIMTPFMNKGFRVSSERAIVGEYKDGALSFYSPDFAKEWYSRYLMLKNWENLSEENILSLEKNYYFSYILVTRPKELHLNKVYENKKYTIYKIKDCP